MVEARAIDDREQVAHARDLFPLLVEEPAEEVLPDVLAVVDRAGKDNMLLVEDYLARVSVAASDPSAPAPPAAGGAV